MRSLMSPAAALTARCRWRPHPAREVGGVAALLALVALAVDGDSRATSGESEDSTNGLLRARVEAVPEGPVDRLVLDGLLRAVFGELGSLGSPAFLTTSPTLMPLSISSPFSLQWRSRVGPTGSGKLD